MELFKKHLTKSIHLTVSRSEIGQIIENQWINMPNQYDNVQLDKYIIMSNHIHGILIINKRTGASPVPTISNIIGSFKSKTSVEYLKYIDEHNLTISGQIWQRSFHDHIVRTDRSLNATRYLFTKILTIIEYYDTKSVY